MPDISGHIQNFIFFKRDDSHEVINMIIDLPLHDLSMVGLNALIVQMHFNHEFLFIQFLNIIF